MLQLAPVELDRAGQALNTAEYAWRDHARPSEVDHLAYLAKQQAITAIEAARTRANQATPSAIGIASSAYVGSRNRGAA